MSKFDSIFEKAQQLRQENLKKVKEEEKKEAEKLIQRKIESVEGLNIYKTNNKSKKLLKLIEKYGFIVKDYEQINLEEDDCNYYDYPIETYSCQFGPWKFSIQHFLDMYTSEGLFIVSVLTNEKTHEEINFHIDLNCQTTGEEALEEFLKLLNCESEKDFVVDKYGHLIALEQLLKANGIDIKQNTLKFSIRKIEGYLKLEDNIYLKPLMELKEKVKLVVTNTSKWLATNYNSNTELGDHAYEIQYESIDDFKNVQEAIQLFAAHMAGEIGFFEKGVYYSNSAFRKFINQFKHKYPKSWDHYLIRINEYEHFEYDRDEYNEYIMFDTTPVISKLTGIELFYEGDILFNNAAHWSEGEDAIGVRFTLCYDKKTDPNVCTLRLKHITFKNQSHNNYETILQEDIFKVSYLEACKLLEDYILHMADIFDIRN